MQSLPHVTEKDLMPFYQHVAKTARALGKNRLSGSLPWELVWNALPAAAVAKLPEMNPKQLCSTAWAFSVAAQTPGAARYAAPELFDEVAIEARGRVGEFNGQDVANMAWAFASVNHEVFHALTLMAPNLLFHPVRDVGSISSLAGITHLRDHMNCTYMHMHLFMYMYMCEPSF